MIVATPCRFPYRLLTAISSFRVVYGGWFCGADSPAAQRSLVRCASWCIPLILLAARVHAQPIGDSFDEWSVGGVQGERNWFYGYYNLTDDVDGVYQASDFMPFFSEFGPDGGPVELFGNHWSGAEWNLSAGPESSTGIQREATHPGGANSDPNKELWTIRRWVSDRFESALIT